jgi:hypothetical protein
MFNPKGGYDMRMRSLGWFAGSLGLLLGAGSARADDQPITGQDIVNQMAGKPECRDAGVTVSFTTGSVELDTNAQGALNGVATWMKADSKRTLHLRGYADTTGNSETNLVLSEKRANAVKDYLVTQGVDATQIMTVGRGEDVADQLPANGRTVTFLACKPPAPLAQGETPPAEDTPAPPVATEVPQAVEPVPVPAEASPAPKYEPGGSKFGFALMAGGGYQDFSNSTMRNLTNGGGAWDVRFIGGTRSIVGFEGAYIGSARSIQSLGATTANNPNLISNGLEGNFRLNAPIIRGDSLIEPYGVVGIGWSQYHVANFNSNTATLSDFNASNDNVMTVPFGLGFAYGYKALMVDVRGTYTATYYDNLLQGANGSGTLNTWGVGGQVGFAF